MMFVAAFDIKNIFSGIKGRVLFEEPLSDHTTFRIGGPCRIWVEPREEGELRKILKLAASKKKKVFIIGMGSNVLPRDKGLNGIVICLRSGYFKKLRFAGTGVTAGAGVLLGNAVNLACKKGLRGIEGLAGIPGTIGGAIFMNAGYKANISDCLESVRIMDKKSGKTSVLKKGKIKFSYRHSGLDGYIILEAAIALKKADKKKLLERRNKFLRIKKSEQPIGSASAGCVFKNPGGALSAARCIDMLGLKGKKIGGAEISSKHANFIVNSGGAKAKDVIKLMNFVKKRVKEKFSIDLKTEIQII